MAEANQQPQTPPIRSVTAAIDQARELDDWVSVDVDGLFHVRSGKVELGTGVRTALAQIAAEELDLPLEQVQMEMGDTDCSPDEGYTAGSKTIRFGGRSVRVACAEARTALIEAAAQRFGVGADRLVVSDGTISVLGDREKSVSYRELAGGRPFNRKISENVRLKTPADYRLVGTAAVRVDLPGKLTGAGSYVHDLKLPGMLHGRVVRPPNRGARLVSVGETAVTQVVRIGSFLGVVAEKEAEAIRGAKSLRAEWTHAPQIPPMHELYDHIKGLPTDDRVIAEAGDVSRGLAGAHQRIQAEYRQPFQAHASLGPSCAVAAEIDGVMTVWCSSQGVYPLRAALADLLGVDQERVHVVHAEGSGCYGHNGADDVAADAVLLARETG
ncbi:MAG TPA: molybdopterin cofactor-binding domain-containing protein, partial [Spirochaetia bacterium]|nr:molybdopterin cofactor-binding domain-containing protein [Spirochaetia bacterium]